MPAAEDPLLNNLLSPFFDELAIERLWKRMTTYDGTDTSVFPLHNPSCSFTRPLWFGFLTRIRLTKFVMKHPFEFMELSGVDFSHPGQSAQKESGLRECISDLFEMFTHHSYHVYSGCPHGDYESVAEERKLTIGSFVVFVGFERTLKCERFKAYREKWIKNAAQPDVSVLPVFETTQHVHKAQVVGVLPNPTEPPPPSPPEPSAEPGPSHYAESKLPVPPSPSSVSSENNIEDKNTILHDFSSAKTLGNDGHLLYKADGTCTFVERGPFKIICKTRRRGASAGQCDAYVYADRFYLPSGRIVKKQVLRSTVEIESYFRNLEKLKLKDAMKA